MTLTTLIVNDPVIALEIGALLLTVCYLARLAFLPLHQPRQVQGGCIELETLAELAVAERSAANNISTANAGMSKWEQRLREEILRADFPALDTFSSFFEVGNFVPMPKRSLDQQRVAR